MYTEEERGCMKDNVLKFSVAEDKGVRECKEGTDTLEMQQEGGKSDVSYHQLGLKIK